MVDLSDDDPFNVPSSKRKPAPAKKSAPKSRGITFDSDSDEDIMPVKKRKRWHMHNQHLNIMQTNVIDML